MSSISVKDNDLSLSYLIALLAFAINILNIVAWSVGWYVPSTVNLVLVVVFFSLGYKSSSANKTLFLIFIVLALLILGSPVSGWDARSIWFFHAKRMFFDNNLYAQLDDYAPWSHNDYPVLFSSIAASIARTLGCWNEIFPRLGILVILFPVFLTLTISFREKLTFNLWIIGALIFCGKLLYNGYMDAILALYCSAAAVILILISESKSLANKSSLTRLVLLLILILITLPFIKNEGLLAFILLFFCSLPLLYRNIPYVLGTVGLSLIYLYLWNSQLITHKIHSDLFTQGVLSRGLARLTSSSDMFAIIKSLLMASWKFFLVFFLILRCKKLDFKSAKLSFLFVLLYLSAILTIYCITPHDLQWHLKTSASRTFLTVNMTLFSILIFLYSRRNLDNNLA